MQSAEQCTNVPADTAAPTTDQVSEGRSESSADPVAQRQTGFHYSRVSAQ